MIVTVVRFLFRRHRLIKKLVSEGKESGSLERRADGMYVTPGAEVRFETLREHVQEYNHRLKKDWRRHLWFVGKLFGRAMPVPKLQYYPFPQEIIREQYGYKDDADAEESETDELKRYLLLHGKSIKAFDAPEADGRMEVHTHMVDNATKATL